MRVPSLVPKYTFSSLELIHFHGASDATKPLENISKHPHVHSILNIKRVLRALQRKQESSKTRLRTKRNKTKRCKRAVLPAVPGYVHK